MVTCDVVVAAPRDEEDWRSYLKVAEQAFGRSPCGYDEQRDNGFVRVAIVDGEVVGGMMALPFRQFFGSRPVASGGLAAGCVAPEYRRSGVARRLVEGTTDALRQVGAVVASGWTPSPGVYRGMGWEAAGGVHGSRYPIDAFRMLEGGSGKLVRNPHEPATVNLQRELASDWDGALERPAWWKNWKEKEFEGKLSHYGVARDGDLAGLLSFSQEPQSTWGYKFVVKDLWTSDAESTFSVAEFIAGHSTMVDEVHFLPGTLPPTSDFFWFLPQHRVQIYSWFPWIIRLIDLPGAIRQRGWPRHIRARVELRVDSNVEGSNEAILEVEDGEGRLTPGGKGNLAVSEQALASWYAGGMSMSRAARIGLASGEPESLKLMDQLTANRNCWLPDTF